MSLDLKNTIGQARLVVLHNLYFQAQTSVSEAKKSVFSCLMSQVSSLKSHVSGHKRKSRTLCIPKWSPIQVLTQLNVA